MHAVTSRFLGRRANPVPYVIGIGGSVAVGKSTTARVLSALFARGRTTHRVEFVTTDGFLLPNAELDRRGIMHSKGFPESYDTARVAELSSRREVGQGHRRAHRSTPTSPTTSPTHTSRSISPTF